MSERNQKLDAKYQESVPYLDQEHIIQKGAITKEMHQFELEAFECPYEQYLPHSDRAWHVLTHWIRKTEDELRTYLQNYIIERKDWFLSVSKSYLANLEVSAEDYIDTVGQTGSHLDLLGLFVLSRLYEFHFGLFYNQGVWYTTRNKDYKQTSMMLIFRGETHFGETCVLGKTQEYLDSLIRNTQWDLMPSHNKESKVFGDQTADKCFELSDSDVEILENVSSELTVNTTETKVPKALKPTVKLERIKLEVKSEFRPVGFSKPKNQVATTYNRALKALVKAKKEHASLDVKKESSQRRTQLIMSGTLRPALIANKARTSNKRIVITCEFCTEVQASWRQYIKHRKQMHPNQLWLCKVCSRPYKSYNGCYKHEKSHEDFKLTCGVCGKGFNYKKDLEMHLPVHSEALKVSCPDCGKGFASDRSLARHAAIHQNLQFTCSECSYMNNTKEKLQRHWRGQHGPGFTTLCGDFTYKWPGRRQKHQEECKLCGIQRQLKLQKQFPGRRNE